ncbi:MAG: type I-B CRISPR-associated protein Cas7/Cst2/DevR [Candidatus Anstonellaceae archaeon]
MAKSEKNQKNPSFVLWGKQIKDASGKRAVVSAIFYSFPSNQNAHGSGGTNIITQKIIPWGVEAEPRVYVSPYALKRRIRDYWIKKGLKVYLREDKELIEEIDKNGSIIDYIDNDLFGYMKAERGKSSDVRPGPITTWGAVSCEPIHPFIDFNTNIISTKESNTNIISTKESEKGGSIINRSISKEFYFTSFFINPDIIGIDFLTGKNLEKEKKQERLKLFFEALDYAMQKDSGGARDRPACVFKAIEITSGGYGKSDKQIFKSIKVKNDKVEIEKIPENVDIIHVDEKFVEIKDKYEVVNQIDKIIEYLIEKKTEK